MTTEKDPSLHHAWPKFVSLEGLIGAGKSTIVKAIADLGRPDVIVLPEPVHRWCERVIPAANDPGGTSLLESYYRDAKSVAMAFQMFAMLTRVQQLSDLAEDLTSGRRAGVRLVVAERCSWSDYELFGRPMRDSGLLSEADWYVYTAWFDAVTSGRLAPPLKPDGYAYLAASPETCLRRIGERARPGEDGVDLAYLEALERAHAGFFEARPAGTVLGLDGDLEGPEAVVEAARAIVDWGIGGAPPPPDN